MAGFGALLPVAPGAPSGRSCPTAVIHPIVTGRAFAMRTSNYRRQRRNSDWRLKINSAHCPRRNDQRRRLWNFRLPRLRCGGKLVDMRRLPSRDMALATLVSVICGLAFVAIKYGLDSFSAPQPGGMFGIRSSGTGASSMRCALHPLFGRALSRLAQFARHQQQLGGARTGRHVEQHIAEAAGKPTPQQREMPRPGVAKEAAAGQFRRCPRHPVG